MRCDDSRGDDVGNDAEKQATQTRLRAVTARYGGGGAVVATGVPAVGRHGHAVRHGNDGGGRNRRRNDDPQAEGESDGAAWRPVHRGQAYFCRAVRANDNIVLVIVLLLLLLGRREREWCALMAQLLSHQFARVAPHRSLPRLRGRDREGAATRTPLAIQPKPARPRRPSHHLTASTAAVLRLRRRGGGAAGAGRVRPPAGSAAARPRGAPARRAGAAPP